MDPRPLSGENDVAIYSNANKAIDPAPTVTHEKSLLFNCMISLDTDVVSWTAEAEARVYN